MENFRKALANLREGAALASTSEENVLILTGLVALFEICFEQSWKAMKATLYRHQFLEAKTGSPSAIIKLAFREGMIESEEAWLSMLDDRRVGVHTYSEAVAGDIAARVPEYIELFETLAAELDENWS